MILGNIICFIPCTNDNEINTWTTLSKDHISQTAVLILTTHMVDVHIINFSDKE